MSWSFYIDILIPFIAFDKIIVHNAVYKQPTVLKPSIALLKSFILYAGFI